TFSDPQGSGARVWEADLSVTAICYTGFFSDILRLDPLTGLFVINSGARDVAGAVTYEGLWTIDIESCSVSELARGPVVDAGRFAGWHGAFGNGLFNGAMDGLSVYTWLAASGDVKSPPWQAVPFVTGFGQTDSVSFDRGSNRLFVVDRAKSAVIEI